VIKIFWNDEDLIKESNLGAVWYIFVDKSVKELIPKEYKNVESIIDDYIVENKERFLSLSKEAKQILKEKLVKYMSNVLANKWRK